MKIIKTLLFDFFYLLIGAYIALMFLEHFKPGLISNYVDLNKVLYFLAPIAILCVLVSNQKKNNNINNEEKYD